MKAARYVLLAAFAAGSGCRKPIVEPVTPIIAGCGPLPPLPTLCLETMRADASDGETLVCYSDAVAVLIAELRATRAQFTPCAISTPATP